MEQTFKRENFSRGKLWKKSKTLYVDVNQYMEHEGRLINFKV